MATTHTNDLSERLLQKEQRQEKKATIMAHDDYELISKFKTYSVWIGICCGIFVQLSTLGANFLLVALWGEDAVAARTQKEAMVFSLGWSFFTSCMALVILALLRGLITSLLDSVDILRQNIASSNEDEDNKEDNTANVLKRESLMIAIEVRYVIGALTGVCIAWTFTDLLLGMQSLALYSMGTLALALVWSKFMLWFFVATDDEEASNDADESNQNGPLLV